MFATLILSLVVAGPMPKDGPAETPKGPAPTLQYFKADGDSIVRNLQVTKAVPVLKKVEVTRIVNGKEVKETVAVTEIQTVTETQAVKIEAKTATYATAAGKKLTTDEALARLKDGAICVMAFSPQTVEATYLKAFKAETLVITLPAPLPRPAPRALPLPPPPAATHDS